RSTSAPAGSVAAVSSSVVSGVSSSAMSQGVGVDAALAGDGQGAGQAALGAAQARRVLELAGRVLKAQAERVAALRADVLDELVVGHVAQLLGLHAASASSRVTNFVRTGSLWPARRMASRASGSGTPASSNITRPGLTTATQPSGEPLPEPMRVSAGFLVK